ncbi:Trafficking protein particle complex subunit 8 [Hondaea fermentalgiana]|uniref:Trafficking protein particle complex subunit 8 n=1 Tax=Hondaea fermentalgiana TaxID=2315210 RepID=A0A2R5GC85_9STRA|nr:Trafficking protein particle complex subunit 8 [Hondaea fermentalgiana]|eukprot:GBG28155.1 Trafficking protein particle complex subunit 8 [Hondaea fermentalgiana]
MAGRGSGEDSPLVALQRRLHRAHAPLVLVQSTENANLIAERDNGLTLPELLAPFGVQEGQVPFRTPMRSYGLREFRVDFAAAPELEPISFKAAEELLHSVVQAEVPKQGLDATLRSGPEDSDDLSRFVRTTHKQPWYAACRDTLTRTFQHHETEMFGSPVGCMVVTTTADGDPMTCFEQLKNPHFFPSAYQNGQYDPNVPMFYLLLHDTSDPRAAEVDAEAMAAAIKAKLPTNSFFFLSDKDIKTLKSFTKNLIITGVLSSMEGKISELDARVTAQRKGLRNTFRSFWRKPKEGAESSAASYNASTSASSRRIRYLHDTIESNIRLLADLAFMVQDYELALSMYRIARDDFGGDKELLHQGSALEMMAICNLMRGSPERDTLDYVRRSQACYKDLLGAIRAQGGTTSSSGSQASMAARFLTKSTFLFVDIVLAFGGTARLYREATELLARASLEETPLCAAVLLEQTGIFLVYQELASTGSWSYSLLSSGNDGARRTNQTSGASGASPQALSRRLRKFGFHMVMAGLLFKKDHQVEHALRCLATVRALYQSSRWAHIKDHLASTMAEHAAALGDLEHALPFWAEVLERGDEMQPKQATIMDEMEHRMNAQDQFKADADWPFSLPIVDDARIGVHRALNASVLPELTSLEPDSSLVAPEDDVTTGANESARALAAREARKVTRSELRRRQEAEWVQLHSFLDLAAPRPPGLKAEPLDAAQRRPRRGKRHQPQPQVCYAGESVYVDVPMRNPCALKLAISEIQLIGQLVDEEGNLLSNDTDAGAVIEARVIDRLVLDESSERMVRLEVLPTRAGTLTVIGVQWRLFGKARVRRMFDIHGPLIVDTQEDRVAGARAQDLRLQKTVRQASAWLGADLDLAQTVFEGETVTANLFLINRGALPCSGHIVIGTNAPTLCVGSAAAENDDAVVGDQLAPVLDDGGRAFKIPVEDLGKGLPMSVPVVIRMPSAGHVSLRLLLRYHDGTSLRFVRLAQSVEVLPSIRMGARCLASPLPGSDHLLCCNVRNLSTKTVCLRRIVAFSGTWQVEPLGETKERALLGPQETRSFLLRVARASPQDDAGKQLRITDVGFMEHPEWQLTADDEMLAPSFQSRVHFLCAEYASSVLEARTAAKRRFEYFKDKLDAEGKLPVSIQSIRRLKQAGSQNPEMDILSQLDAATKPADGEPRPCDKEALCFGSRSDLVHLLLEWTATSSKDWAFGHAEELSIPVMPDCPLKVSLEHAQTCTGKVLPVTFHIENVSGEVVRAAVIHIDKAKDVSWRGFTRISIPDLRPGGAHSLKLLASFHMTGLVNLGLAKVYEKGKDDKPLAACAPSFVSVMSIHGCEDSCSGSDEPIVGQIEAELSQVLSSAEPCAPMQSPPPPPPMPVDIMQQQQEEESFMWSETSHAGNNMIAALDKTTPVRPPDAEVSPSAVDVVRMTSETVVSPSDGNSPGAFSAEEEVIASPVMSRSADNVVSPSADSDVAGVALEGESFEMPDNDPNGANEIVSPSSDSTMAHIDHKQETGAAPNVNESLSNDDTREAAEELFIEEENETPMQGLLDVPEPDGSGTVLHESADALTLEEAAYGDAMDSAIASEGGEQALQAMEGQQEGEVDREGQREILHSPPSAISKRTSSIELETALREELEDSSADDVNEEEGDDSEDDEAFLKQELASP